ARPGRGSQPGFQGFKGRNWASARRTTRESATLRRTPPEAVNARSSGTLCTARSGAWPIRRGLSIGVATVMLKASKTSERAPGSASQAARIVARDQATIELVSEPAQQDPTASGDCDQVGHRGSLRSARAGRVAHPWHSELFPVTGASQGPIDKG